MAEKRVAVTKESQPELYAEIIEKRKQILLLSVKVLSCLKEGFLKEEEENRKKSNLLRTEIAALNLQLATLIQEDNDQTIKQRKTLEKEIDLKRYTFFSFLAWRQHSTSQIQRVDELYSYIKDINALWSQPKIFNLVPKDFVDQSKRIIPTALLEEYLTSQEALLNQEHQLQQNNAATLKSSLYMLSIISPLLIAAVGFSIAIVMMVAGSPLWGWFIACVTLGAAITSWILLTQALAEINKETYTIDPSDKYTDSKIIEELWKDPQLIEQPSLDSCQETASKSTDEFIKHDFELIDKQVPIVPSRRNSFFAEVDNSPTTMEEGAVLFHQCS